MDSKSILRELDLLKESDYNQMRSKLESFSVDELEILALDYASLNHHNVHYEPGIFCSILTWILLTRSHKLNRNFEPASMDIDHYLHLNDRIESSLKKAVAEAKNLVPPLDKRIKEKDPFLDDYEIRIKLIPLIIVEDQTTKERYEVENGIYRLLCDTSPNFSYRLEELTVKDNLMFEENWYDLCGMPRDKLIGHHICYFMHEIWEHTHWSIPDILHINEVWTEVCLRYQHFEENIQ
jgi:hypothetical protein